MATEGRILQTSAELFMRYGVKSVTMDDIAKELAISKKTIYQFFKDKNEIVHRVAQLRFEEDHHEFDRCMREAKDPVHYLLSISDIIKNKISKTHPTVLYDLRKYHPDVWALFKEHRNCSYRAHIMQVLEKGVADGLFRKEMNVEILAEMRMSQIELSFDPHVFPPDKYPMGEVHIQLFEHFVFGILTAKGLALMENYKNNLTQ